VGFDENGKMTNHSFFGKLSWPQIVNRSAKIVNFYDLGGSEKALKSSIKSISTSYLDYLAIVVSASSGITTDTVIFLKFALAMELPVIIVVTKIDLLDNEDQTIFLNNLNYIIKAQKCKKNPLVAKSQEDIVMFSRLMRESIIPIFLVSNKSGKGLDLFINFLNVLPTNTPVLSEYDTASSTQVRRKIKNIFLNLLFKI
jgi:elongation factor 1-alpha